MTFQKGTFDKIVLRSNEFVLARGLLTRQSVRNLCLALCSEAGEIAHLLRWLSDDECNEDSLDDSSLALLGSEIADVVIFATALAEALKVDLDAAIEAKQQANMSRLPQAWFRKSTSSTVLAKKRA